MAKKRVTREREGILRRAVAPAITGAILIGGAGITIAQTRPATDPPATQPAATQPGAQTGMNLRDVTLSAFLDQLQESDGLKIVNEAPPDLRLTGLTAKKPMSREESVQLLNTALQSKNYTAILRGSVLRIVEKSKGKKSDVPVHFGTDPSKIEQSDELITQVMPVKTLDAVRLRQDLTPLIGEADITANQASNAIVMTDTSANIHRVAEIIYNLDKHEAGSQDLKVVHLKFADAQDAAKLVMTIFRPDLNQQQNQGPQLPFFFRGFNR